MYCVRETLAYFLWKCATLFLMMLLCVYIRCQIDEMIWRWPWSQLVRLLFCCVVLDSKFVFACIAVWGHSQPISYNRLLSKISQWLVVLVCIYPRVIKTWHNMTPTLPGRTGSEFLLVCGLWVKLKLCSKHLGWALTSKCYTHLSPSWKNVRENDWSAWVFGGLIDATRWPCTNRMYVVLLIITDWKPLVDASSIINSLMLRSRLTCNCTTIVIWQNMSMIVLHFLPVEWNQLCVIAWAQKL